MTHRDPTANTAIGNIKKSGKGYSAVPRGLVPVGPRSAKNPWSILDGLLPHEAKAAGRRALALAGNKLDAITREHIQQARDELFPTGGENGPGGDAA